MSVRMDGGVVDGASCTSALELCDGVDNDCDPSTLDGADEPERCDATVDADACEDDQPVCSGGVLTCMNLTGTAAELCDGVDNDCDPDTRDGSGAEGIGESCEDAGVCGSGSVECVGAELSCDAVAVETCNGHDDNCDMAIDETGCDCARVLSTAGRRYLFCDQPFVDSAFFNTARDRCRSWGYELASVESAEEHAFIASEASRRSNGRWWTGGNDQVAEGSFTWVGTTAALTYTNWAADQPDNFAFAEDCVAIDTEVEGSNAKAGWFDRACIELNLFVCEEAP